MSKYVDYGLGVVKKCNKKQTMESQFKPGLSKDLNENDVKNMRLPNYPISSLSVNVFIYHYAFFGLVATTDSP